MKKFVSILLCLIMVITLVACGNTAKTEDNAKADSTATDDAGKTEEKTDKPAEVQKPVKITVVSHFTEDYLSYASMHAACEDISEKTGGTVTFEYFPHEQMVKANEIFDAVSTGLADMAPLFPGNATGTEPMLGASDQPFEYDDAEHFLRAWNAGQRDIMEEVFASHNIKLLGVTIPYLSGTMIMTRKLVKSPADMAGLKIRTSSVAAGEIVTSCGASPVSMSSSEYYLALSTNTIDGVTTSLIPGLERSVQEVVTNILDYNMSTPYDFAIMSLDTWNKLTPGTQQIFLDHFNDDYTRNVLQDAQAQDKEGRARYTGAGVTFYTPTADEAVQWREVAESAIDAFIASDGVGELGQRYLEIAEQTKK
jgi:TRAP-type C4-dicarboxylate transport system substrate-binding protein